MRPAQSVEQRVSVSYCAGTQHFSLPLALEISLPLAAAVAAIAVAVYWLLRRRVKAKNHVNLSNVNLTWDGDGESSTDSKPSSAIDLRYLDVTTVKLGAGAFAAVYKGYYSLPSTPSVGNSPTSEETSDGEKVEVAVKVLHPRNAVKHRY